MLTPRQQIEMVSRAYAEGYRHGVHDGVCVTKHLFNYRDESDSKVINEIWQAYPMVSEKIRNESSGFYDLGDDFNNQRGAAAESE